MKRWPDIQRLLPPRLSRWLRDHAEAVSVSGLCLLIAWQAVLMIRWACADSRPPTWDEAVHLTLADQYLEALLSFDVWHLIKTQRYLGHSPYPPVYHFLLAPWLAFFEPQRAALFANFLVYSFLLAGVWRLGRAVSGVWHGLLAAFLIQLAPFAQELSRCVLVDLLLTAWTVWCYVFLLESDGFKRRGPSIALGICAGLGVLTKWTLPSYLLPMAFWLPGIWRKGRRNLLISVGIAAAIAVPWLAINIPEGYDAIRRASRLGYDEGFRLWRLDSWLGYLFSVPLFFPGAVWMLLAGGAGWALWRRKALSFTLAGWLMLSLVFWTFVSTRDPRFVTPAMPALSVLGIAALPAWSLPLVAAPAAFAYRQPRPAREDWHHEDILDAIEKHRAASPSLGGDSSVVLMIVPNLPRLNSNVMRWAIRHGRRRGITVGGIQTRLPEWCDYVLIKSGDPGVYLSDASLGILDGAAREDSLFRRHYSELARWPAPDGGSIGLFSRTPRPDDGPKARSFESIAVRAADLTGVRLTRISPGTYRIEADSLFLRKAGLRLKEVHATLQGADLVFREGRVHVMRVESVAIGSLFLPWSSLRETAERRLRGLRVEVEPGGSSLAVDAAWGAARVRLAFGWSQQEDSLLLRGKELRLFGIPIPLVCGRLFTLGLGPRPPNQSYRIRLGQLLADSKGLRILPPS